MCVINQSFTLREIGEKAWEKKQRVYVGFTELEKLYNRISKEVLWQLLIMYDVGGKFVSFIKSIYINKIGNVKVKGSEEGSR